MASVEMIHRKNKITGEQEFSGRYRGVPWDALTGKKGPTRSFTSQAEAYAYARGWERAEDRKAAGHGIEVERNRSERTLWTEYAADYAINAPGEKTSVIDRKSHARQLATRWAGLYMDQITKPMVIKVLDDMEAEGKAPGTRRKRLTFIRSIIREAMRDCILESDCTVGITPPPRVKIRAVRELTESELQRLIAYMPNYLTVAILLAHDSGLRCAEVVGLRWGRVNLDAGRVLVADVAEPDGTLRPYPKGKRHRTVALTPRTVAAMKRARMKTKNSGLQDRVVVGAMGEPLNVAYVATLWKRWMDRCTVIPAPMPTFHDLRHNCAYRLVRHGVSLRVLQDIMGHASLDTTRIYMPDVTVEEQAEAMARVPVGVLIAV